tara:strand:+ start:3597 stop:4607 length:1011 start_codon:yes stop_codon:yes gene_type:complete
MSSSDYTNLRRIRHVYYPTLSNTVSNCTPTTVTYSAGNSYILPSTVPVTHTHSPVAQMPVTHAHAPVTHNHCDCNSTVITTPVVNTNTSLCDGGAIVHPNGLVEQVIPDKTTSVTTANTYLVAPKVGGTETFLIDKCNIAFSTGSFVSVVSELNSSNYFEGEVYSYDKDTGLLQIKGVGTVTGDFTTPSKYIISIVPAYKELELLRARMAALYKEVFNIDLTVNTSETGTGSDTGSTDSGTLTAAELTTVVNTTQTTFSYFFASSIAGDSDYAQTEAYITTKVNELYTYFFDIDLTSSANSTFNPNNNGVAITSLPIKIEQMNLYFFGTTTPTITA